MKIRYLLIFILMIMCSGCSVSYNLDIDKINKFSEHVIITGAGSEDKAKIDNYNGFLPVNFESDDFSAFEKKIDGVNYYKKYKGDNILKFDYVFNFDEYFSSMFSRSCYKYVTVMKKKKDTELLLSTSNEFLCFSRYDNLSDVKVTIASKYKLKETNADIVEKHKYTWNIDKSNFNNKNLYLLLDLTKRDLTLWERIVEGEYTNIFTISVLLVIIGGIILFILKKKGDRKNRI